MAMVALCILLGPFENATELPGSRILNELHASVGSEILDAVVYVFVTTPFLIVHETTFRSAQSSGCAPPWALLECSHRPTSPFFASNTKLLIFSRNTTVPMYIFFRTYKSPSERC